MSVRWKCMMTEASLFCNNIHRELSWDLMTDVQRIPKTGWRIQVESLMFLSFIYTSPTGI